MSPWLLRFRVGSGLTERTASPLGLVIPRCFLEFRATPAARPAPLAPVRSGGRARVWLQPSRRCSRYPAKTGHVRACSPVHVNARTCVTRRTGRLRVYMRRTRSMSMPHPPRRAALSPTLLVLNYARGTSYSFFSLARPDEAGDDGRRGDSHETERVRYRRPSLEPRRNYQVCPPSPISRAPSFLQPVNPRLGAQGASRRSYRNDSARRFPRNWVVR